MQQKTVSKYTKEQTCEFAKEVLFRHYGSRATQIKYIGGGSFGYVYKAELPAMLHAVRLDITRYELLDGALRADGYAARQVLDLG